MTSKLRPPFIVLLASLLMFGQAPAWLHVAGCSEGRQLQAQFSSDAQQAGGGLSCSHCCHRAEPVSTGSEAGTGENKEQGQPSSSGHEHDSGSCPLCQSLVTPSGFVWSSADAVTGHEATETLCVSCDVVSLEASHLLPPSRGPPSAA